ncbi:hypothetical protein E2C01_082169 [Portunus trituberculatus]|uniref:Uncharacterized protein n=1 Tax=Portunus trituberculatus TaxID=210409 RepID=A0A5B7IP83_PORTR|nr:hypothetical protein [Portunus trituberculatus]
MRPSPAHRPPPNAPPLSSPPRPSRYSPALPPIDESTYLLTYGRIWVGLPTDGEKGSGSRKWKKEEWICDSGKSIFLYICVLIPSVAIFG